MNAAAPPPPKPTLRGVSHEIGFYVALVAGVALVVWSPPLARVQAAVYAGSLATLLGVSALYHRPTWAPAQRRWLRRLDHAAIFVLIAGTATPFSLLLPAGSARALLAIAWGGTTAGVLQAMLWVDAPKPLIAALYLALGWAIAPFVPALAGSLGRAQIALLFAGGVAYSVGAVVYARRRPNPAPLVFGYHEIFHALVLVAAVLHFVAVAGVVRLVAG